MGEADDQGASEEATEVGTQRPGEATQWKKGESPAPGGRLKGLVHKRGETQLEAMRWVLAHPKPKTFLQDQMRKHLRESREKFMAEKAMLEKASLEKTTRSSEGRGPPDGEAPTQPGSGTAVPVATPDVGTTRCVELAESLIKRLREERGKK